MGAFLASACSASLILSALNRAELKCGCDVFHTLRVQDDLRVKPAMLLQPDGASNTATANII